MMCAKNSLSSKIKVILFDNFDDFIQGGRRSVFIITAFGEHLTPVL